MQPTEQLKDYMDIELKALVYDHLASIDNSKQAISTINQELQKRANEPKFTQPVTATEPVGTGEVTTNEPT